MSGVVPLISSFPIGTFSALSSLSPCGVSFSLIIVLGGVHVR